MANVEGASGVVHRVDNERSGPDGRRDEVAHAAFVAAALSRLAPALGHREAMAASKRLVAPALRR